MVGWRSEPLGNVCQFINRGIAPSYLVNDGVAVLNQRCVRDHSINFDLGRRHNAKAKKVPPEKFIRFGDVLVNSTGTGTLGRVAQVRDEPPEPTTVDSHVTIVRPSDGLFFPEFFGYAMVAIEDQIQEGGEGCGGQTELARSKLATDYRVGFPADLAVQRRIVAILDEAFEGIATAKANAERNLGNARELVEELMQSLYPEDLVVATEAPSLDDLCEMIVDCEHKTAPTQEVGIPSIRTPNIGKGRLLLNDVYRVSEATYEEWTRRAAPRGGDLILAREAPAGNVAVVPEGMKVCLGQRTVLIRPKKTTLEPEYLAHLLLRRNSQRRLLEHSRGATVQHINMKDIRAFKICGVPSLEEQRAILKRLNSFLEYERRLVGSYQAKLAALDELKKSLLHRAFTGAL